MAGPLCPLGEHGETHHCVLGLKGAHPSHRGASVPPQPPHPPTPSQSLDRQREQSLRLAAGASGQSQVLSAAPEPTGAEVCPSH